jgi:hypothetical protein
MTEQKYDLDKLDRIFGAYDTLPYPQIRWLLKQAREAERLRGDIKLADGHTWRDLYQRADAEYDELQARLDKVREWRERDDDDRRPGDLDAILDSGPAQSDKTKNDHGRGLYRKYRVERTDGSSGPGGKHEQCRYFVLDLEHDQYSIPALAAYSRACRAEYPALAADLDQILAAQPERQEPSDEELARVARAEFFGENYCGDWDPENSIVQSHEDWYRVVRAVRTRLSEEEKQEQAQTPGASHECSHKHQE